MSAPVDESAGEGEHTGANGAGHGELAFRMDVAQPGGPAQEIVGEDRAAKPGGVGEELARRAMLESRPFFQVTNGQFDPGVVPVECVGLEHVGFDVGDKTWWRQSARAPAGGTGEPGAAHDQT